MSRLIHPAGSEDRGACDLMLAAPLSTIVTTDTVPIVPQQRIEIVSVAGLLARHTYAPRRTGGKCLHSALSATSSVGRSRTRHLESAVSKQIVHRGFMASWRGNRSSSPYRIGR